MQTIELDLIDFIARFKWRPMSWQRRVKNDMASLAKGELAGCAPRDLSERERHCLYRLAWAKMQTEPSSLAIPVKEWLAANGRPISRKEERTIARQRREAEKAKTAAEPPAQPRLL